jgi:transcriptional regulator with XRE-family HTH domain
VRFGGNARNAAGVVPHGTHFRLAIALRKSRPVPLSDLAAAVGGIRALAVECGVSPSTAHAWVHGHRTPSIEKLWQLAVIAERVGLAPPLRVRNESGTRFVVPQFVPARAKRRRTV